jgi:serine protease Do
MPAAHRDAKMAHGTGADQAKDLMRAAVAVGWLVVSFMTASALGAQPPEARGPSLAPSETATAPSDIGTALARQEAAVVLISSVKFVSVDSDDRDAGDESEALAELLRRRGIPLAEGKPLRVALRDTGCGIILTSDGYILTSAHVVSDAVHVSVRPAEGREYPARLVGLDLPSDIAVLKIDTHGLPVAALGRSGNLRPGAWVAAIGAPFGFAGSLSSGIVSALHRTLPGDETYLPYIQTDLALNPGNSGGPLVDADGEVVGINAEIAVRDGGSAGISFAIPIEVALAVEEQLLRQGRIERGDIGIAFQDMDEALARAFGLQSPQGALVHTVEPGGPAARAALRPGDVILQVDARGIARASELAAALAALKPGTRTTLGIWRDRALARVSVGVEDAEPPPLGVPQTDRELASPARLLSTREISAKERDTLGTDGRLIVTSVSATAAAAGLEAGDIVLRAGAAPLETPRELEQALRATSGTVALLIEHEGVRSFIALPLERAPAGRAAGRSDQPLR